MNQPGHNIVTNLQYVAMSGTVNLVLLSIHIVQTLLTLLYIVPQAFHLIRWKDSAITQSLSANTLHHTVCMGTHIPQVGTCEEQSSLQYSHCVLWSTQKQQHPLSCQILLLSWDLSFVELAVPRQWLSPSHWPYLTVPLPGAGGLRVPEFGTVSQHSKAIYITKVYRISGSRG